MAYRGMGTKRGQNMYLYFYLCAFLSSYWSGLLPEYPDAGPCAEQTRPRWLRRSLPRPRTSPSGCLPEHWTMWIMWTSHEQVKHGLYQIHHSFFFKEAWSWVRGKFYLAQHLRADVVTRSKFSYHIDQVPWHARVKRNLVIQDTFLHHW